MKHLYLTFIWLIAINITVSCGGSDDGSSGSGNGNGNGTFSYTDIGPDLGAQWMVHDARRSDTGLWALYSNSNSNAHKLARYDFSLKQWQFWDFEEGIKDFDVWLEGEDNGNGAVVIESTGSFSGKVHSLSAAAEWDIEDLENEYNPAQVALGWGPGGAAFSNWIGAHTGSFVHSVFQETGTCCPLEWNKIDIPSNSTIIYDMWASSRQDGYALVSTASQSFIFYSDGGAEITFDGSSYAVENVAWDTQTGVPYVLIDGILYRIEANPNANSAAAVAVADLTAYNHGVTFGVSGLDIRAGKAYVPYGAVVDLSNGSDSSSWIGEADSVNIDDMMMVTFVSISKYVFTPPNDQDGVFVHVRGADPNTFESYETWIRVDSAM